jgi:hypothetical protein
MALKSETMATMITPRDEKMIELAQLMDSYVLEAARLLLLYEPGLEEMDLPLSTKTETTAISMDKDEGMTAREFSKDGLELSETHPSARTPIWMELGLLVLNSETTGTT